MSHVGNRHRPETRVARLLGEVDPATGAVVPAMQPSSTFARDADYQLRDGFEYARSANPTCLQAERLICDLEDGAGCLLYASGLGAAAGLVELIPPGQRIAVPRVMYHGFMDWLKHRESEGRIVVDFYDAGDPASLKAVLRSGETAMVWLETPANPNWDVVDIAAAAELARNCGAWLAVDSTCASPVLTRPLSLGADFVMHSATKYLNGHSDVIAGAIVTRHGDMVADMAWTRSHAGSVTSPFDAWLLIRGMRTLFVRVERACRNAMAIAQFLEDHPAIDTVFYPGLPSHPQHEIAKRQMEGGFGGMLSVLMAGGEAAAAKFVRRTELFLPATSLGGVESLIEHRKAVEGPNSIVPPHLVRLSVGIEAETDLIEDLRQALTGLS